LSGFLVRAIFCLDVRQLAGKNETASTVARTPRLLILRIPFHHAVRYAVCGCLLLATSASWAEEPAKSKTAAGLRQQLREEVTIAWEERGLRSGLQRLSDVYGIAIFLDRRIDPGFTINAAATQQPLQSFLQQVASEAHAGITAIGPVVYVGPPETTSQLSAVAAARRQEIGKLSNEVKARLLHVASWQWDELTQPRQLLAELAHQANVKIENAAAIPLDLWPAVNLPPLAWCDRLTLLLAGFGLMFEVDQAGATVRLIHAAVHPAAEASSSAAASPPPTNRNAKPNKNAKESQGNDKLYTLTVENRAAAEVVALIAKNIGKEVQADTAVREALTQKMKFTVKDATLDYLMEMTLKPLGLRYRLTEQALVIERQ
jgi:hypothetical protein